MTKLKRRTLSALFCLIISMAVAVILLRFEPQSNAYASTGVSTHSITQ